MASTMASSREETIDVPTKHEASDYPTTSFTSPEAPLDLKRRRSEQSQDTGEKRQKLDCSGPYSKESTESPTIAELAEQASKAVLKQYELEAQNQNQNYSHSQSLTQTQTQTQSYQSPLPSNTVTVPLIPTEDETRVPAGSDFKSDPYLYIRIFSLPILESLSTQILSILAQGLYSETIRIVQDADSELGQAYATLKSLFDQTKRIYSDDEFYLCADELNIKEPEHRTTIRTANLASFAAAVFSSSVGFYELRTSRFISIVTPDGACLEKEPGELLVNLKTQMYLSMVTSEEQTDAKEDVLEDIFPYEFEEVLKQRHPDIPLSQDEYEIVNSMNCRREYLMNEPTDVDAIQALSEKFGWEGFLKGISSYLSKNYEPLLATYMKRHALTAPAAPPRTPAAESHQPPVNNFRSTNGASSFDQDISMHAQLAADEVLKALGYDVQPQENAGMSSRFSTIPSANVAKVNQQKHQPPNQSNSVLSPDLGNTVPYPTQSAPTQVLYEKARRAASTKANTASSVRRPGTPNQRRSWTSEEENTLMAGLDQVKGPHWSQILALYGPSGSLNDVLRDRNQVQLKDKARNLKLFFLKSGIEVPYYLQCVTGELKTRAPTQAAKREAEQRALLASEDEQMHQEGISALSGMVSHGATNSVYSSGSISSAHSEFSQDDGVEELQVVEPETDEKMQPRFQDKMQDKIQDSMQDKMQENKMQDKMQEMQKTEEAVQEPTKPPTLPMLSDEGHLPRVSWL